MYRFRLVAVMSLGLSLLAGPAVSAVEDEPPAVEGRCGERELSVEPFNGLDWHAQHLAALDICAGWLGAAWDTSGDEARLTELRWTIEVAGDVSERPPGSYYNFSFFYPPELPGDHYCRAMLRITERVGNSDDAVLDRTCYDDSALGSITHTHRYELVWHRNVRYDGQRVTASLEVVDEAAELAEVLTDGTVLTEVAVQTGITSGYPYSYPAPGPWDFASGGKHELRAQ